MIIYYIFNPYQDPVVKQEFATLEQAQTALPALKAQVLIEQVNRFSINVVTQVSAGEQWDLVVGEDYPENGDYRVFNQNTGQHEPFTSFSQAKAREVELENEFIDNSFASQPVEENTQAIEIPTEGTQTL
jgi:hypothetical protein